MYFFPDAIDAVIINLSTVDVVLSKNTTGSLNPSPLIAHLLVFLLIASETRVGLIFLPDFLIFLSLFSSFLLISPNFFFPLHFKLSNTFACLFFVPYFLFPLLCFFPKSSLLRFFAHTLFFFAYFLEL